MKTARFTRIDPRRILWCGLALVVGVALLWSTARWGATRWETISLASEPARVLPATDAATVRAAPVSIAETASPSGGEDRRQEPSPVMDRAQYPEQAGVPEVIPGALTVDLNRASLSELDSLPGIGPALAERVLALRDRKGRFQSVDDLMDVAGIGVTRLARLRPFVTVGAGD